MTKLQKFIVRKAYRKAKKRTWFSGGVCTDLLKNELSTDSKIKERGIDKAVDDIYYDTAYWDSTPFYNQG